MPDATPTPARPDPETERLLEQIDRLDSWDRLVVEMAIDKMLEDA